MTGLALTWNAKNRKQTSKARKGFCQRQDALTNR